MRCVFVCVLCVRAAAKKTTGTRCAVRSTLLSSKLRPHCEVCSWPHIWSIAEHRGLITLSQPVTASSDQLCEGPLTKEYSFEAVAQAN